MSCMGYHLLRGWKVKLEDQPMTNTLHCFMGIASDVSTQGIAAPIVFASAQAFCK